MSIKSKGGPLDTSIGDNALYQRSDEKEIIIPHNVEIPKMYFGTNLFGFKEGDIVIFTLPPDNKEEGEYKVIKVDIDGRIHVEPIED